MKEIFETASGECIERIVLEDGDQSVALLSIGGCTQDWRIAHGGRDLPVLLGFDDPRAYIENPFWFGAIAGRVANRIGGGGFLLDDQFHALVSDDDGIVLHGGPKGLSRRVFSMEIDSAANAVEMSYHSPNGEEGFPGALDLCYVVTLRDGVLHYDLSATPDRPTPVALAQHNYYNLMGHGDIWDHHLLVKADRYTPTAASNLPDGRVVPVDQHCDFRSGAVLKNIDSEYQGLDRNLILDKSADRGAPLAVLSAANGLKLSIQSDQPAMQIYTSGSLASISGGIGGRAYGPFSGICLEPQNYPNAVNTPHFPSPICTPDRPYSQRLEISLTGDGH
ncbi:MAG: aldose epimerase family protein [Pseudoruegeria sp.]